VIHVLEPDCCRTGEQLKITRRNQPVEMVPTRQVGQVVLHSFAQISKACCFVLTRKLECILSLVTISRQLDTWQEVFNAGIRQYTALSN